MTHEPMNVYVVTANEEERVKDQEVYANLESAWARFTAWKGTYGGANVCIASLSALDSVPPPRGPEEGTKPQSLVSRRTPTPKRRPHAEEARRLRDVYALTYEPAKDDNAPSE